MNIYLTQNKKLIFYPIGYRFDSSVSDNNLSINPAFLREPIRATLVENDDKRRIKIFVTIANTRNNGLRILSLFLNDYIIGLKDVIQNNKLIKFTKESK